MFCNVINKKITLRIFKNPNYINEISTCRNQLNLNFTLFLSDRVATAWALNVNNNRSLKTKAARVKIRNIQHRSTSITCSLAPTKKSLAIRTPYHVHKFPQQTSEETSGRKSNIFIKDIQFYFFEVLLLLRYLVFCTVIFIRPRA